MGNFTDDEVSGDSKVKTNVCWALHACIMTVTQPRHIQLRSQTADEPENSRYPGSLCSLFEKVQDEIKTYVKPGQLPRVEDRKKMPYTDAVIHEIQRFCNIVPLNVSHSTATDEYLRGYLIPKGTEITPFLTSVLYDKTQWKTPYDFNPNHFLDENGKFVKHNTFMPFSAGKKSLCWGKFGQVGTFPVFHWTSSSIYFLSASGVSREDLNLKPGVGFLLLPTPYMTCAKPNY
ncbi:unnamed protein product [Ranitomeya imitator]|uniref:Cytochrome P450 n=1 Tax=Ranitomeya imitator TaxID=111125 RepID=A0ABN9M025_9NEOB|nr:unnamed protein product [Ranitomeya imitator]